MAPGFFGTKVRMVALVERGRNEEVKNCEIAHSTSSPTIDQAALKKAEVKPSGPGDLLGLIFFNTLAISSRVGAVDISWRWWSEHE